MNMICLIIATIICISSEIEKTSDILSNSVKKLRLFEQSNSTIEKEYTPGDSTHSKFTKFKFIAHRGGICENVFEEYDPRSISAAIDSGYWMLEIDVRPTKDSVLVVNHHDLLKVTYNLDNYVSKMLYEDLRNVKAVNGGYSPMLFEEVLKLMKKKNIRIMLDLKLEKPLEWFNRKVNKELISNGMLEDAMFIRNDVEKFYNGGKFGIRMSEIHRLKKMVDEGKDVSKRFYLFDHGNRINAETVRWCQKNNISVCASVNFGHYTMESPLHGAKRDIDYLVSCGVTIFQIDSDFDVYFNNY